MAYTINSAKDAGGNEDLYLQDFIQNQDQIQSYKNSHGGALEDAYQAVTGRPWPKGRSVKVGKNGAEMTKDRTAKSIIGKYLAAPAAIGATAVFAPGALPALAHGLGGALGIGGGAAGAAGGTAVGSTVPSLIPGFGALSGVGAGFSGAAAGGAAAGAHGMLKSLIPSGGDILKGVGGFLSGRSQAKSEAQARADSLLTEQRRREDEQRKQISDFLTGQMSQRLGATQMDPYAQAKSLQGANIRRSFAQGWSPQGGFQGNFDTSAFSPENLGNENTKFQAAANDEETKKKILDYLSQIGSTAPKAFPQRQV